MSDPVLIVSTGGELPGPSAVWGTDARTPPEGREALDWLTLVRLLGWGATVSDLATLGESVLRGRQQVVLACDPDAVSEEAAGALAAALKAHPMLVVARAAGPGTPLARMAGCSRGSGEVTGRSLRWEGPGPESTWESAAELEAPALEASPEGVTWATIDEAPILAARRVGKGIVATLAFHPSAARDLQGGAATALLRELLTSGLPGPSAWLDLAGSLILRMDDPGGAVNVHLDSYSYRKLDGERWSAIGSYLRDSAGRMSIAYVGGWVDDGDETRGTLLVRGERVTRTPGGVHPSPLVSYSALSGHAPGTVHDYGAEFRGVQSLRRAGLGDAELHGYTHIHPDAAEWARAPDRYDEVGWYRELGESSVAAIARLPPERHPLALGVESMRRYFGVQPTTLICPGDEWAPEALGRALDLGLRLVSTSHLAVCDGSRFCWATHIHTPYLSDVEAVWFDAGLPVVAGFHDIDLDRAGVEWMIDCVDRWQAAGARRLIDFRELASMLGRRLRLDASGDEPVLRVDEEEGAPPLVRPLPVQVRFPDGRVPAELAIALPSGALRCSVEASSDGTGRLSIPSAPAVPRGDSAVP